MTTDEIKNSTEEVRRDEKGEATKKINLST